MELENEKLPLIWCYFSIQHVIIYISLTDKSSTMTFKRSHIQMMKDINITNKPLFLPLNSWIRRGSEILSNVSHDLSGNMNKCSNYLTNNSGKHLF